MQYENLGPVWRADGTPTDLTKHMLSGEPAPWGMHLNDDGDWACDDCNGTDRDADGEHYCPVPMCGLCEYQPSNDSDDTAHDNLCCGGKVNEPCLYRHEGWGPDGCLGHMLARELGTHDEQVKRCCRCARLGMACGGWEE